MSNEAPAFSKLCIYQAKTHGKKIRGDGIRWVKRAIKDVVPQLEEAMESSVDFCHALATKIGDLFKDRATRKFLSVAVLETSLQAPPKHFRTLKFCAPPPPLPSLRQERQCPRPASVRAEQPSAPPPPPPPLSSPRQERQCARPATVRAQEPSAPPPSPPPCPPPPTQPLPQLTVQVPALVVNAMRFKVPVILGEFFLNRIVSITVVDGVSVAEIGWEPSLLPSSAVPGAAINAAPLRCMPLFKEKVLAVGGDKYFEADGVIEVVCTDDHLYPRVQWANTYEPSDEIDQDLIDNFWQTHYLKNIARTGTSYLED